MQFLIGLVIGAFVAALSTCIILRARAATDSHFAHGESSNVDGDARLLMDEMLKVLRSASVMIDSSDRIVHASADADRYGVIGRDGTLHPEIVKLVQQSRQDSQIHDLEMESKQRPEHDDLFLYVRVGPLESGYVLVLADDRTDARRVEEARRDFSVNVSHELKTPVGAISLLAETMYDAAEDPDAVRRFAHRMQREAKRLSTMVQEILDLSRLQVHEAITKPERVRVDGVIAEAVDRCRMPAEDKQIEITIGPRSGLEVMGDSELLVTAVRNLIENAIRYSDEGTSIGVNARKIGNSLVDVIVTDQGIGISPADLKRVFERFYRVDPARSRQTGGTGLGLSIVKHVAAKHGGEIRVWSKLGHGSTFTLRLPAAPTLKDVTIRDKIQPQRRATA